VVLSALLPGIDLPTSIVKIPFVTDPAAKSAKILSIEVVVKELLSQYKYFKLVLLLTSKFVNELDCYLHLNLLTQQCSIITNI
jgi:hypothetical protein